MFAIFPRWCYHQPGEEREKPARALGRQLNLQLGEPTSSFRRSRDCPPFVGTHRICGEPCFQRNLIHWGFQILSWRRNLCWAHHSFFRFPASLLYPTQRASKTHTQVRKDLQGVQGVWTWVPGGWILVEEGSDPESGYYSGSKKKINKFVF